MSSTNYNYSSMTPDDCIPYVKIVEFFPYRLMQFMHLFVSVAAIIVLFFAIYMTISRLAVHSNLKILLLSLFAACIFHALSLVIYQSHQLILSVSFNNPCDVILSPLFYQVFHYPLLGVLAYIDAIQILMVFERTVATVCFRAYERTGRCLGIAFVFISLLFPVAVAFIVYGGKPMDDAQVSVLNTPRAAGWAVRYLFMSVTTANVIAVISSVILIILNRKGEINETLTAKYQKQENKASTKLLAILTSGSLFIFCIYGGCMVLLGYLEKDKNDPWHRTYTMMAYTIPWYTLLMPVVFMLSLMYMERKRKTRVDSVVHIEAIGEIGWKNYAEQLKKQWKDDA